MAPYPKALRDFPTLRQSLLSEFDQCPLGQHFKSQYSNDWSAAPAARGHIAHQVLAKCLATMADAGEERIEVDVALAILNECLRQADVPDEDVVPVPLSQVAELYWVIKKFAADTTWSIGNLIAVEERLSCELSYPDPEGGFVTRTFTGQPDAIFAEGVSLERGVVLDWKDTWAMPGPSEVSEGGFFQQRSYALLLMRNYSHLTSVTLREFYLRYSEAREATIYREQLDDIEGELCAVIERFDRAHETERWPPQPGKHCSWCPAPTSCPIFPRARRSGSITNAEEAAKRAEEITVWKAALKQSDEALRAWTEVHGPVPIRDAKGPRVLGYRSSTRTERPTREALDRALEQGIDPRTLYRTRETTRFDAHVPQPQTPEPEDDELLELLERSAQESQRRTA